MEIEISAAGAPEGTSFSSTWCVSLSYGYFYEQRSWEIGRAVRVTECKGFEGWGDIIPIPNSSHQFLCHQLRKLEVHDVRSGVHEISGQHTYSEAIRNIQGAYLWSSVLHTVSVFLGDT